MLFSILFIAVKDFRYSVVDNEEINTKDYGCIRVHVGDSIRNSERRFYIQDDWRRYN